MQGLAHVCVDAVLPNLRPLQPFPQRKNVKTGAVPLTLWDWDLSIFSSSYDLIWRNYDGLKVKFSERNSVAVPIQDST